MFSYPLTCHTIAPICRTPDPPLTMKGLWFSLRLLSPTNHYVSMSLFFGHLVLIKVRFKNSGSKGWTEEWSNLYVKWNGTLALYWHIPYMAFLSPYSKLTQSLFTMFPSNIYLNGNLFPISTIATVTSLFPCHSPFLVLLCIPKL